MVASSDFEGRHAEVRTILRVANPAKDPTLVLDKPLEFTHEATVSEIDEFFELETRTAVAILSRNIKIQGDQTRSEESQQGAIIMVHSTGGQASTARLNSVEFNHVGQAYK